MNGLDNHLAGQLHNLEQQGLLRRLVPLTQSGGNRIDVSGKNCLNLSGNDYLGLAANRELVEEFYSRQNPESLLERFGPGSSASRLMTGNSTLYEELERKLASLYNRPRALVFNSGYHANAGILPALAGKGDLIIADKLCHASLIDGMQLSRAESVRYRHQDYEQLGRILAEKRSRYNRAFIVSESVFSMDGDLADLGRLAELKKQHNCTLYLDEAHAVGVFGDKGLGLAEQEGLVGETDILLGTFGKALGGLGGFALCSDQVADYLINRARPFIYSTGLPPVCLNWLLFVLDRVPAMHTQRTQVLDLADNLRRELIDHGLATGGSSQIIPVIIGDSARTVAAAEKLRASGFWVTAVRPPTVPANTARLRLSISAAFTPEDLEPLPALIKDALG